MHLADVAKFFVWLRACLTPLPLGFNLKFENDFFASSNLFFRQLTRDLFAILFRRFSAKKWGKTVSITANFRHFFVRGLTILLPSILTIWILITAYNLIQQKIADPISSGMRYALIHWSPWPQVHDNELKEAAQ